MDPYNILSKVKFSIFPQKKEQKLFFCHKNNFAAATCLLSEKYFRKINFLPESLSVCITLNINSLNLSVEYCKIICLKKIKKTHAGSNVLE